MTVRPLTPDLRISGIRLSGFPESPKPPDIIVIPSKRTSRRASAGVAKILFATAELNPRQPRAWRHRSCQGWPRPCYASDHGDRILACPRRSARQCHRSEEHTSELKSLMRISYAVFCL